MADTSSDKMKAADKEMGELANKPVDPKDKAMAEQRQRQAQGNTGAQTPDTAHRTDAPDATGDAPRAVLPHEMHRATVHTPTNEGERTETVYNMATPSAPAPTVQPVQLMQQLEHQITDMLHRTLSLPNSEDTANFLMHMHAAQRQLQSMMSAPQNVDMEHAGAVENEHRIQTGTDEEVHHG